METVSSPIQLLAEIIKFSEQTLILTALYPLPDGHPSKY